MMLMMTLGSILLLQLHFVVVAFNICPFAFEWRESMLGSLLNVQPTSVK